MDNETIRRHRGDRIRQARGDLTQRALADRIGVTPQAISAWEQGASSPYPDKQLALAEALGVSWSSLFAIDGEVA